VEHLGVEVEVALTSGRRRVRVPRKSGIVVGDDVSLGEDDRIEALPRRSELVRRSFGGGVHVVAANVDIVLVVAALDPPARAGLIDRASVAARAASIEPIVIVNKVDLTDATGVLAELRARLEGELAMHAVSAKSGLGMDELAGVLVGKRAVLVGPSGVGKSSLKNALVPGLALETRALSDTRGAGMHTTTSSTLHALPGGGEIVDTPGVREYGLVDVLPRDLALYFPGFAVVTEACRFRDCLHEEEPGCAIKAAVADGRVREGRYVAYRNLLAETKSLG
jgi:ribosome biogenesis GTPase